MTASLVDWSPALRLLLLAAALAALPLGWVVVRVRRRGPDARPHARLAVLTALTLFLTFDLVVFGAFTRLSDSGLGCPDWPGCYGSASPLGAHDEIHAAAAAAPGGPVSWPKAWIEMVHRYLAMTVGALIVVVAALGWRARRGLPFSVAWPLATLGWVVVQGLFGRYTVTLKLYPAVVTLHLLGGLALLALLARQHAGFAEAGAGLPAPLRPHARVALALLVAQVALGGWVSSNYAVLACAGFPQCNGQWWPSMDWGHAFVLRGLGEAAADGASTLERLVAIHMAHRLFAVAAAAALALLAWRAWRAGAGDAGGSLPLRRRAAALAALLAAQLASGLSNVVLGWPLAAALAHSAGAAGLVLVLVRMLAPAQPQPDGGTARALAAGPAQVAA